MKRNVPAIILIPLAVSVLLSGPSSAQSIFGVNFIGEHRFRGSPRDRALAFSTFAVIDSIRAATLNTASMADLANVTFTAVEVVGLGSIETGSESISQSRFQLPTVMVAAPVRKGLVLGVGYRTRFEGWGESSFERKPKDIPLYYEIYKRRGSLFTVPLTAAWRINRYISVAGELQLERGSIKDDVTIEFHDPDFEPVRSGRNRVFTGTSWSASVLVTPVPRVCIGACFDDRVDYNVNEEFSYTREDLDSTAAWEFSLPEAFGAGIAVGLTDRWWLSGSYWGRAAPDPAGFRQLEGSLGDERLIALGIERRRAPKGGFFSRIPLRLGFYENRWHLEFPRGNEVIARFVTIGTGFRMPGGPGSIDVSAEFGQIGSAGDNLLDEKMVRFGIGVSASETWSRRKEGRR